MSVPPIGAVVHERDELLTAADIVQSAEICAAQGAESLAAAFVLALRTAMSSGVLPPGAIMLGHRATWFAALEPGEYRTTMAIREADAPRTRYQRVVIGYATRRSDHQVVLDQAQEVLWPNPS
jgi:hypothetical protein